jgi:glycosyltransferase involved in cell wall biosynthesis
MMATWKGVHQVLFQGAYLYQDDLKKIGIESIDIYGGAIYKTAGDHQNYYEQIQLLNDKLGGDFVTFKGLVPPFEIYQNIDILIHSSLSPAPFGRVLIESWAQEYWSFQQLPAELQS